MVVGAKEVRRQPCTPWDVFGVGDKAEVCVFKVCLCEFIPTDLCVPRCRNSGPRIGPMLEATRANAPWECRRTRVDRLHANACTAAIDARKQHEHFHQCDLPLRAWGGALCARAAEPQAPRPGGFAFAAGERPAVSGRGRVPSGRRGRACGNGAMVRLVARAGSGLLGLVLGPRLCRTGSPTRRSTQTVGGRCTSHPATAMHPLGNASGVNQRTRLEVASPGVRMAPRIRRNAQNSKTSLRRKKVGSAWCSTQDGGGGSDVVHLL